MLRPLIVSFLILLGTSFFSSCNDFFEPELKNKKVVLISPGVDVESRKYNQTFMWEAVEDTKTYRLQVGTPVFDSIAEIVLDTLVAGTKFAFTLEPGRYEWRVRAENSASSSLYTVRKLIILESSLSNQQVQLISPAAGLIGSSTNITFKWQGLFGATGYRLEVDSANFSDPAKLLLSAVTTDLEYTLALSRNNTYNWRIRAESDTSESKWSVVRSFTFDNIPPAKVSLNTPVDNSTLNKPVSLQWEAAPGASKYVLQLYKSDRSTPYSSSFPVTLTSVSYSVTVGEPGETLYWKVCAIDAAGNTGSYSDLRSFIIQ